MGSRLAADPPTADRIVRRRGDLLAPVSLAADRAASITGIVLAALWVGLADDLPCWAEHHADIVSALAVSRRADYLKLTPAPSP